MCLPEFYPFSHQHLYPLLIHSLMVCSLTFYPFITFSKWRELCQDTRILSSLSSSYHWALFQNAIQQSPDLYNLLSLKKCWWSFSHLNFTCIACMYFYSEFLLLMVKNISVPYASALRQNCSSLSKFFLHFPYYSTINAVNSNCEIKDLSYTHMYPRNLFRFVFTLIF